MKSEKIEYTSGQTRFIGELFRNEVPDGRRPGVVVFPEAFGLNDHARQRAERLARSGYIALAADLHGQGQVFSDMASLRPNLQALYADRSEWRSRARAAFDTLLAQPQVDATRAAAIGFCFGGTTCFELARSGAPLSAIATFHAGLLPALPEDSGRITARVLVCHGVEDPVVPQSMLDEVMAELKRDRIDWQFIFYGNAAHSFTDPDADGRNMPGFRYDKRAEARSWMAMQNFFDEVFA